MWGFIYCNDPAFVFYNDFLTKDDIEEHFYQQLCGPIDEVNRFVKSVELAGYKGIKDGSLSKWICEKFQKWIAKQKLPLGVYFHPRNYISVKVCSYSKKPRKGTIVGLKYDSDFNVLVYEVHVGTYETFWFFQEEQDGKYFNVGNKAFWIEKENE